MKEIGAFIGVIVGIFATVFGVAALSTILNGWVLSIIWSWFFVPTLNLPIISISQAIGISLVAKFLTYQSIRCMKDKKDAKDEEKLKKFYKMLSDIVVRPLAVLLIAWIVTLFM